MIINPLIYNEKPGRFTFASFIKAECKKELCTDIIREMWHGHTFTACDIELSECEETVFRIGNAPALDVGGNAYSINVTENGVCVAGKTARELAWGITTLLERITPVELCEGREELYIPCCEIFDRPATETRMVHLCIFPNTTLEFIKKFVRLAAVLKYTHIIVEFWGMLKFDCMKELGWSHAFTKDQLRPIFKEANVLGMEIIPMFNHIGHASQSRSCSGKHTILDQNPRLQTYFSDTGWAWDFKSEKVKALHKKMREELCDLCGEGSYFHIGCDEVYGYEWDLEKGASMVPYINEIADDIIKSGRTPVMWGDMMLCIGADYKIKQPHNCSCRNKDIADYFVKNLDRRIIIADWQYEMSESPFDTSEFFKDNGFNVLVCPWFSADGNIDAAVNTAKECGLDGVMLTTWHTLETNMQKVLMCAMLCWNNTPAEVDYYTETAALIRKICPSGGNYEQSGWSKEQVTVFFP